MISLVSCMSAGHRGGVRAPSIAGAFVVLALTIGGTAAGARAELQTWTFGGTVTQINYIPGVPPSMWSEVQVGDPWSLSYTFDTDGADQAPGDPRFGHYLIDSFTLAIGPAMTSMAEFPPGIFVQPPGHYAFGGVFNVFPDVQDFVDLVISSETEIFSSDAMPTTIDLNDFLSDRSNSTMMTCPLAKASRFSARSIPSFLCPERSACSPSVCWRVRGGGG